ncbi:hypothetical protein QAD02_021118 [Eretmocerus hayati]|uniref:Uncharacterized protein n=1 Tax=Eretmocerus hayati TaxID=131215 RepID=A0ACC2PPI7_9HYME|nr:hypothetical protein QAD02_021118 [Eretmocerus hayati]
MNLRKNQLLAQNLAVSMVPIFDGQNLSVDEFIDELDLAHSIIEPQMESVFLRFAKTKLFGKAREYMEFSESDEYSAFRIALYDAFRSYETIPLLFGKLGNAVQNDDEPIIRFTNRVRKIGRQIINVAYCEGRNHVILENLVEQTMIDTFLGGLETVLSIYFDKKPDSISEAVLLVHKIIRGYRPRQEPEQISQDKIDEFTTENDLRIEDASASEIIHRDKPLVKTISDDKICKTDRKTFSFLIWLIILVRKLLGKSWTCVTQKFGNNLLVRTISYETVSAPSMGKETRLMSARKRGHHRNITKFMLYSKFPGKP